MGIEANKQFAEQLIRTMDRTGWTKVAVEVAEEETPLKGNTARTLAEELAGVDEPSTLRATAPNGEGEITALINMYDVDGCEIVMDWGGDAEAMKRFDNLMETLS